MNDDIQVTPEEAKNGWTNETLRAYIVGRQQMQEKTIHTKRDVMPSEQNHKYNPHQWRR
jgi:hypothetical protein